MGTREKTTASVKTAYCFFRTWTTVKKKKNGQRAPRTCDNFSLSSSLKLLTTAMPFKQACPGVAYLCQTALI